MKEFNCRVLMDRYYYTVEVMVYIRLLLGVDHSYVNIFDTGGYKEIWFAHEEDAVAFKLKFKCET